jgi:ubiquinone/menaquinone biosynthesis C-methylase UbiE
MDWSIGRYERVAEHVLPAARIAVDRAAPGPGERVVDVGCGSGNASLLAAARGARVTGVDPAARLLEVAREQAAARGLEATFAAGEAASLPLADGEADLVLSVFGAIFAPDAGSAAAEMARVTASDGRMVLTAWIPEGGIFELVRARREAMQQATGAPVGSPTFAWHDRDALAGLLEPHGFEVTTQEEQLAFGAKSPSDFFEAESAGHPAWVTARAVLEPRGEAELLRQRSLEILRAANEDPDGFRVTSRYVVVIARR